MTSGQTMLGWGIGWTRPGQGRWTPASDDFPHLPGTFGTRRGATQLMTPP